MDYSGGKYLGLFAYGDRRYTKEEVAAMNIVSFTIPQYNGAGPYARKKILIRDPDTGREIVATALDICADSDTPNNDCTRNAGRAKSDKFPQGVLLDIEWNTANRFYSRTFDKNLADFPNKVVQWRCVDC